MRLLVDSGAVYSLLPKRVWKRLGLRPIRTVDFRLADGSVVERDLSQAEFFIGDRHATSQVVLGNDSDSALLGVVSLETLGFALNPRTRKLVDLEMRL